MRSGGTPGLELSSEPTVSTTTLVTPRLPQLEKPDFSTKRKRSILLDRVNPITNPNAYKTYKTRPARATAGVGVDKTEGEALAHNELLKQRANPYRAY